MTMDSVGTEADLAQQLPIDIAYAKLGDWLVDRKKIPADWRKRLVPIQARTLAALSSLPSTGDSWIRTLTSDSTGYLEAKRVRDVLLDSTPDARGLFGRLSGPAAEWDSIVRAYEKDFLFLGDSVQILLQNTNYEIPYQKKQISKVQQQLADLDHKEAEFKRNAAASALKYQQACLELGIPGSNVRAELLGLVKTLPEIFEEVTDAICGDEIGNSLDFYKAFVAYAHTKPHSQPDEVLVTLRDLREHPEKRKLKASVASEIPVESIYPSVDLLPLEKVVGSQQIKQETTIIDWDVDAIVSMDADDVKDTGIYRDVQATEDELGDMIEEIQNNDGLASTTVKQETFESQTSEPAGITWDTEAVAVEGELSEICWDIAVEDETPVADPGTRSDPEVSGNEESQVLEGSFTVSSSLVDTACRNRLLDDLFELKAFLRQRLDEMHSEETAALQDQVRAVAPADVQQHGSDSISGLIQTVARIMDVLMNDKTRNLIMILTSPRYLDRLEASLKQKKQTETKLLESLSEFSRKRLELRNTLTTLWPRQDATLTRTRDVKKFVESTLSAQYNGRPVNIIGEINTLLGYS